MPTGREIMERVGILLNDEDAVRWPLAERCDWINEAQRAIVLAKPSASTSSRILTLQPGTLQVVPQDGAPQALMLVSITRNLKNQNIPREGGRVITPTNKAVLDAAEPSWHVRSEVPYKKEVRQYVFDEANPLEWYCYPGNDGTGIVEAVISTLPEPLEASGDPEQLASYEQDLSLPETYSVPITDFVLYRCQLKDDLPANASRAAGHYQTFASAIGLKIQVEGANSPNRNRGKSA